LLLLAQLKAGEAVHYGQIGRILLMAAAQTHRRRMPTLKRGRNSRGFGQSVYYRSRGCANLECCPNSQVDVAPSAGPISGGRGVRRWSIRASNGGISKGEMAAGMLLRVKSQLGATVRGWRRRQFWVCRRRSKGAGRVQLVEVVGIEGGRGGGGHLQTGSGQGKSQRKGGQLITA
jgi:hypothetical protein